MSIVKLEGDFHQSNDLAITCLTKLQFFKQEHAMNGYGAVSVALHVTRFAIEYGLPVDPSRLVMDGGGRVKGLCRKRLQSILRDHGISNILSGEAGRTNRGSLRNMRDYTAFLNACNDEGMMDLRQIEAWWIARLPPPYKSRPLKLRLDSSKSFRAIIKDLLDQAYHRQQEARGTMIVGAVMQHLVGAKLDLLLGSDKVKHHGSSVADASTGRAGDFLIDDLAIHVTASPTEALLQKCKANLDSNLRPIIVTLSTKTRYAEDIAPQFEIIDRVEVFEIEQFLASNIYELSRFSTRARAATVKEIVDRYNDIIKNCESDPRLLITLK